MNKQQQRAIEVLSLVLSGGKSLVSALETCWQQNPLLSPHDRASIQNLSFGTLRFWGELCSIRDSLLRKPLTDPAVALLLGIALFQIRHTRTAPHAVVDHAVKTARHLGRPHLSGLTNGVLRTYLRQRSTLDTQALKNPEAQWSIPSWWLSRLQKNYPQDWESILQISLQPPPFTLRVNRRCTTPTDYLQLLQNHNLEATPIGDHGLILTKPCPVWALPGFREGLVSVQDYGAQIAAPLLDLQPGQNVLDACAAPGGKAAHILELCSVNLTTLDIDAHRLQRVADNLQRLQLQANLQVGDASNPSPWWRGQLFDRILADVPCSASGVLRRHPDIKWLRRPGDWPALRVIQQKLLEALWELLAPGGKLLYATCSIFPDENEEQIADFLSRHPSAKRLPVNLSTQPSLRIAQTNNHVIEDFSPFAGQLLPLGNNLSIKPIISAHDGFFYALLAK